MKRLKTFLTVAFILSSPAVFAHGYWMEIEGSHKVNEPVTIKLFFGEYISGERLSGNFLDRMKEIKVFARIPGGKQQPVEMKQLAEYWEGTFIPLTEGNYEIVGVNDEREVQDWTRHNLGIVRPVQYLKANYQAGTAITPQTAGSFLDITVNPTTTGAYAIQVFKNNNSIGSATVVVTHPDKEETVLNLDKEGKALFTAPRAGLYIIDAEWIDKTQGEFKGKKYETVRHKLDFSLYHQ